MSLQFVSARSHIAGAASVSFPCLRVMIDTVVGSDVFGFTSGAIECLTGIGFMATVASPELIIERRSEQIWQQILAEDRWLLSGARLDQLPDVVRL